MTSGNPYGFVEFTGWQVLTPAEVRAYLRRQGVGIAAGRAAPFLNDYVSRAVFDTVQLDIVKDE
jgi:hypothetical protein